MNDNLRFLPLLVVVAIAPPAHAQDWRAGTGRLEGKVMDAEDRPLAGATVRLELGGRGGTTLTTDAKGRWAILGLTGGEWAVELSAEGYVSRRFTLEVDEHRRRPVLEVRLERAAPKGPPPDVVAALEQAEAAYKEGHFAEARREYEKLLALRPDLAGRILQQIGFCYVQEKEYSKALESLLRALAAEPDNVAARVAAVQAAFEAEEPEEGKKLLATVDPSRIHDPDVFFNFGIDLVNAGATREAIVYFSRAIDLDPDYADGYYRRGLAHLELGETAQCRADLQKVVALTPRTPQGEMARKALETLP
jgi:tetratricopeptide (TPR) repeat protein